MEEEKKAEIPVEDIKVESPVEDKKEDKKEDKIV